MEITKHSLHLTLTLMAIFVASVCLSQSRWVNIKDSTGLRSYTTIRGDTILIGYDSAYVLNKKTFKLFQENYKRVQNGNPTLKLLFANYENVIALQDSMLKTKEGYYQQLKANFDSVITHSNTFIDKTSLNINSIDNSLSNATNQLNNIKLLLDDSLDKLKSVNRQRIKLAVGGFVVGIGVAAVIFAITR
ncbi:MAG TPA: hypothetical protein VF540_08880 [Segetibacter sp.]